MCDGPSGRRPKIGSLRPPRSAGTPVHVYALHDRLLPGLPAQGSCGPKCKCRSAPASGPTRLMRPDSLRSWLVARRTTPTREGEHSGYQPHTGVLGAVRGTARVGGGSDVCPHRGLRRSCRPAAAPTDAQDAPAGAASGGSAGSAGSEGAPHVGALVTYRAGIASVGQGPSPRPTLLRATPSAPSPLRPAGRDRHGVRGSAPGADRLLTRTSGPSCPSARDRRLKVHP